VGGYRGSGGEGGGVLAQEGVGWWRGERLKLR